MTSGQVTYLVVGGCGFLGHHIVSQLLESPSARVGVLDLRTNRNRFPKAQYFDGDITSKSEVSAIFANFKPAVVFHTVSPLAVQQNRPLFDRVNIEGTKNLLECAGESGYVKAFVFTSSGSVVYDGTHDLVSVDESMPVLKYPQQPEYYSHTKAVAEELTLKANRKYNGMLTCAIRPSGIFGEGDVQAVPPMLNMYRDGRHIWQPGDNKNFFDWTYVGNAAHAHILAAKALLQTHSLAVQPLDFEKVDGEAFFVTNDEPGPWYTLPHLIWRAAGWKGKDSDAFVLPNTLCVIIATILEWIYWIIFFGKKEPRFSVALVHQIISNRTFNIEKAKKRLGYRRVMGLEDAVNRSVKWFVDQEADRKVENKKSK